MEYFGAQLRSAGTPPKRGKVTVTASIRTKQQTLRTVDNIAVESTLILHFVKSVFSKIMQSTLKYEIVLKFDAVFCKQASC